MADGARLRATARKHAISYDALWRHWRKHLTQADKDRKRFGDAPTHKLRGMVAEESISVLKDLNYARHSILEALNATPPEDARVRGQISGELSKSPLVQHQTNNFFLTDPNFAAFQTDLARALGRYPEALAAVVELFEKLEQSEAPLLLENTANADKKTG